MMQEDRACGVRDCRRPRSVVCHAFNGAVQITARSSPTHDLERRLVRFLRFCTARHSADLRVSYLRAADRIPLGSVGRNSSVFCHPFDRHLYLPSALDTSRTALKSTSCSICGSQPGDLRSFGPLSCTYVISFPGPHSELPVCSFCLVHRDRHSRPARAPVHAPAHLPSHVALPIMQAPARSESTSLSAPRGGRCRLLMRSAGFPRQQTCDHRLGCGWYPYRRETLLRGDARLFRDADCGVAPV